MKINLEIENNIDLKEKVKNLELIKVNFSSIRNLQGNKDYLELSFQHTKKEMLEYGG